eukprot:TRINITY_DN84_c0_g1_i1.p1 TRINITY_DN84_c0_g1~~TRINITY_DN84_c0_g1_i1.p1  ORF type:complete len:262 (-),score=44.11 TRINITY_DN84_c0_g1_i1:124-909(-)
MKGKKVNNNQATKYIGLGIGLILLFTLFYKLGQSSAKKALPLKVLKKAQAQDAQETEKKGIPYQVEALSFNPRIFLYHNFLLPKQCDYLINLGSEYSISADSNSPYGAFLLNHQRDSIIKDIEHLIAEWTQIPIENGEVMFLRQTPAGIELPNHVDYFYGPDSEQYIGDQGNRLASVIIFLEEPEQGGEVYFPEAKIKIPCKKGDALLYFNLKADGSLDEASVHSFAKVVKGNKWTLTKWLRQSPAYHQQSTVDDHKDAVA